MDNDDGLVFMQHADLRRHGRFERGREDLDDPFAAAHAVILGTYGSSVVFKASGIAAGLPLGGRNLREKVDQDFQQKAAVVGGGDVDWATVFERYRAG